MAPRTVQSASGFPLIKIQHAESATAIRFLAFAHSARNAAIEQLSRANQFDAIALASLF